MARAKAIALDEEKADIIKATLLFHRACHGARALLAAGSRPEPETLGAILASGMAYADQVHQHLTRRR